MYQADHEKNLRYPSKLFRYHKLRGKWKHVSDKDRSETKHDVAFRLITWNVDFFSGRPAERIEAALKHLREDVLVPYEEPAKDGQPEPCVILFQEVQVRALEALLKNDWVKKHFCVTPVTNQKWAGVYGTVTMVDRTTPVAGASLVNYSTSASGMRRNALLVDVEMKGGIVVRVVSTHLESLSQLEDRKTQMKVCTKLVREQICGGIVAGDMNALTLEDHWLPAECGLNDAFTLSDEEGYTWGDQPNSPKDQEYPPGRFDKVLYTPGKGYSVTLPERIGMGLKIEGGSFVSDHYGLACWVELDGEPYSSSDETDDESAE